MRERITVVVGDIVELEVDAIVNAANRTLLGGGGVDGAIHRAAGPELVEACMPLGGCPPGEARITPGFGLPARHVLHAVGPVWNGGGEGEESLLASCYQHSLRLAHEHDLASLAFPAISTGAYGFPMRRATEIAVGMVRAWLERHTRPDRVVFCCFSDDDGAVYEDVLG